MKIKKKWPEFLVYRSGGNKTLFQKEKNVKWKSKYPEPIAWGSYFEVSLALQNTKILFLIISTKIIAKTDVWFTRRIDSRAVKRDQLINVKQLVAAGMIMRNTATKKPVSIKSTNAHQSNMSPYNSLYIVCQFSVTQMWQM